MKEVKKKSICDNCIHWTHYYALNPTHDTYYCNLTYDTEKLKYKADCNNFEERIKT